MPKKRIRAALGRLLLFLFLITALTSCAPASHPTDVVSRILAEAPVPFPAGTVESSLPDSTLATLYGETAVKEELRRVESYCLYTAMRNGPVEVAVFRCYAASDARAVSHMLLRRADLLAPYLPDGTSTRVAILGRYVILAVSPDPDAVIESARRAIRAS